MTEVTLASLAMDIDARAADPAAAKLHSLTQSAKDLEVQFQRTGQASRDAGAGHGYAGTAAAQAERQIKGLAQVYGNAFNAQSAYTHSVEANVTMLLQNAKATAALEKEQAKAARQVETLTRAYDPLQAEILKTNRQIEDAIKLQGAEGAAVEGLRGKLRGLEAAHTGAAGAAKLQTYQLLNLGRQGADVFVSLASGQALWMVAVQQGAQIGEIFAEAKTQGVGLKAALAGIASQAAPITAVAVPLGIIAGLLAVGVSRAQDNEEALRSFSGQLALNADGLNYNAAALVNTSKELAAYGVGLDDARRGLSIFLKEGVDASQLKAFSVAAKDLSDVIGGDLKAAQDSVSKAFTGGMEAVDKLDAELNFLTASQRSHISSMFDAGQASAAQAEAFRIFSEQVDDAAEKARGPWQDAVRGLTSAWSDFSDTLANGDGIQTAIFGLEKLMEAAASAMRMASSAASKGSEAPDFMKPKSVGYRVFNTLNPWSYLNDAREREQFNAKAITGVGDLGRGGGASAGDDKQAKAYQRIVSALDEQLAVAEKVNGAKRIQLAGENAVNDAIAKGVKAQAQLSEIRSRAEAVARIAVKRDEEAAARSGASAANRATRAGNRGDDAVEQARMAELAAQLATTKSVEDVARIKAAQIDQELNTQRVRLAGQVEEKRITAAGAVAALASYERAASTKQMALAAETEAQLEAQRLQHKQTINGYYDQIARIEAGLAPTLEARNAIEAKALNSRQKVEAEALASALDRQVADKAITASYAEAVKAAQADLRLAQQRQAAEEKRIAIMQRDLGLRQSALDNIVTVAQSEMGLARSAGQRQEIEDRIMAARHDYEVASIRAAIEATNDADQKAALTKKLSAVGQSYSNQVKAANSAERAYYDITSALEAATQAFESNDWARATAALFDAFDTFSKKLKTSGTTLEGKIGAIAGLATGVGNMVGGTGGSALSGAGSGAMAGLGLSSSLTTLGLAIPGPGWALAAVGGILGGIGGLFGGSSAKKKARAEEEARRQAEEAQRQQTIADTSRALEITLLRAQGKELEAVAKEREAELAKLSALSPALAAQQQAVYAALDLAEEQTKAAKLAADQRSLDIQLLEVMGRSEEALGLKRADLLAATDPLLRATQAQIFAEEDLAKKRAKQAEIVNAQASVQDRIDAITKTSAELMYAGRAKELAAADALDTSVSELLIRLWGLEDAAAATAEATAKATAAEAEREEAIQKSLANQATNIGLMRQLMAMDDAVLGTTSARDAARADELAKLDATGKYLQQIVWARQDEADRIAKQNEAMAKAAELLKQRTDLENQLLVALGMSSLATERQRDAIMKGLDPSLRGMQSLLWGVEDSTAAVTAAEQALTEARSAASQAYEREASAIQQTIDKFKSFSSSLRGFRSSLDTGGLAMNDPLQQYARTKADFERVAGLAASGNEEALGSLQGVSEAYLEAAKNAQSTNVGYFKDLSAVKRATEAAQKYADQQVDQGSAQLAALNAQVSALGILNQSTISVGQAVTNVAAAIDALARATSAKSAADAAARNALANAGVIPKPVDAPLNDQSRQVPIGANDNASLAAAKVYYNSANGGVDSALFNRYFTNDPFGKSVGYTGDPEELRKRYGFATGGSFTVGGSGPPDSQVFPLHLSPGEMVNVSRPGQGGNAELVAELRALRQEVADLKAHTKRGADAAEDSATVLEGAAKGQLAITTEAA